MSVTVHLPDDLAAEIDTVADDRDIFVAAAVRSALRQHGAVSDEEVTRINAAADELNREAADVLEYQVIR